MTTNETRRPRLTQRRIKAALVAINAMLAGEEHTGDWPEDVSREDLKGAAEALQARLRGPSQEKMDRISREIEEDYLQSSEERDDSA